MNSNLKTTVLVVAIAAVGVVASLTLLAGNQAFAQAKDKGTPYIVQNTSMSTKDPLPGHQMHQIVIAAPPREDGKVYSGVATFTASAPVEVVVLHMYKPAATPDQQHGEPLNAPFGKGKVAITLMKKFTDSPINSGSLDFAGNALAFHTLSGKPFTVTYTVDAVIQSLTSK
jgi:hypothetical protein